MANGMAAPAASAAARLAQRQRIPFRSVNRRGAADYCQGMQRHHLLPRALGRASAFLPLFEALGAARLGLDDFRANGLLLPACESRAALTLLPLHRGPHHHYTQMVAERVGQIEARWAMLRNRAPEIALNEALMRLALLQAALRRRLLLQGQRRFRLNRWDTLGERIDFTALDAMADALWAATPLRAP